MQNNFDQQAHAIRMIAETSAKKILFACAPADGHFNPLTGIAKHLQAKGYDVRWYTTSAYAGKLGKLNIRHYPYKKAMEVTGDNVDEKFPGRAKIKNPVARLNFDIVNFFVNRGPEYYADMLEIHKTFPFEMLIADCAFTGIPFVADKMKLPVIAVGVFPLTESSKDLAPTGLGITPAQTFIGRKRQAFSRFLANHILFRSSTRVMRKVFAEYGIDSGDAMLFDVMVKKSTLLLQSGSPGFEYKRSDLSPNVRFVGPLLPHAGAANKAQWFDERLSTYKNIVLVTQGTVEKNVEKLLVPTLEALKATDTLVIATTGGSSTEALRQRFKYNNIIIEDFIPFADVMPYADVYVTNGGYGGVMLSVQNQLPMVVAGIHEGKNEINARVGYFGLGINLKTETPSVLQVRTAVSEVLADQRYKNNVSKLAEEFAQYDPNALVEGHVKQLFDSKSRMPAFATWN